MIGYKSLYESVCAEVERLRAENAALKTRLAEIERLVQAVNAEDTAGHDPTLSFWSALEDLSVVIKKGGGA